MPLDNPLSHMAYTPLDKISSHMYNCSSLYTPILPNLRRYHTNGNPIQLNISTAET